MNPQDISIEDFDYNLPQERIPKYPLDKRDESKLLLYRNGNIQHTVFKEINNELPENTLLIFNDSRVIPVRLFFETENGKTIEIFCLEQSEETSSNSAIWKCFVGNLKKWKASVLTQRNASSQVDIELIGRKADHVLVKFNWSESLHSIFDVFEQFGSIPIPPYLKRESEEIDKERYQNVFAHHKGSVAAPTAGLHFTKDLLNQLKDRNIDLDFVTLHVGAGTFKPVKSDTIRGHQMHMERMLVTKELVERIILQLEKGKPLTAVGTTTLRTLESLYWLGYQMNNNENATLQVNQWTPYQETEFCDVKESMHAILNWFKTKQTNILSFATELLILPSYKFRMIDSLVTNFHQPKSTLLLLVAAVAGKQWTEIYNYALQNDFRFLSYGDSSLLFLKDDKKA